MKMKKVLPLLMAAVMMTSGIPMAVSASETGSTSQDAGSAESGTGGADGTGSTSGETGSQSGTNSGGDVTGGTTSDGTGQSSTIQTEPEARTAL